MKNAQINREFLAFLDTNSRAFILQNIAYRYGISTDDVLNEVQGADAEHLLEYITGNARNSTASMLRAMQEEKAAN